MSDQPGQSDHPLHIIVTGKRRTGKSEYVYRLWDSWDGDRVVVDTTGDFIGKHPEPETVDLESPPPARWPEELRQDNRRMSLRFVPNLRERTWQAQCDDVAGMAFDHRDCLLVVEEIGVVAPVNKPMPKMQQVLHHGGHQGLYVVVDGPRVMMIDPLWISQADEVVVFTMASPKDRQRIADNIDFDAKEFEAITKSLRLHHHVRYVAAIDPPELWVCEPLPLRPRTTTAEAFVAENGYPEGLEP